MHWGEMQRSGSRGKPRRGYDVQQPCDPISTGRNLGEGNACSTKWIKVLRTAPESNCEHGSSEAANAITMEFEGSASKSNGNGMPMKALIDEEISREKHARRSPPSLIARLMGLDTLPSPGTFKPAKESRVSSSKSSIKDFREKLSTHEDCLPQKNTMEQQEYKDVFEVVQSPKFEKQKERLVKNRLERSKRHETDKAFVSQSIEVANLSTKKMLQRCKQFDDKVMVLDSYKDIYLPFIQDSPSSFSKYLQDLSCSPSLPDKSCPSILKSSKDNLNKSYEASFRSERNADRYINPKRGESQAFDKPEIDHFSHSSREHLYSLLQKLSESSYSGKDEFCALPTQIVILKPSLENRNVERTSPEKSSTYFPSSPLSYKQYPIVEIRGLGSRERTQNKMDNPLEISGQNIRRSRDIAKRVTKQRRNSQAKERNKISVSKLSDYVADEGSNKITSCISNGSSSQISQWTSTNLSEYTNSSSSLSFCQMESPFKVEAKKRLSQRWKLTSRFQELELSSRGPNTLGEMLALSDSDTAKGTSGASLYKKETEMKLGVDNLYELGKHPSGISSKDGWKDGFSHSLTRSKSLPVSSLVHKTSPCNSTTQAGNGVIRVMSKDMNEMKHGMTLDEDLKVASLGILGNGYNNEKNSAVESTFTEFDIQVSSEEHKFDVHIGSVSEEQRTAFELSDASIVERSAVVGIIPVPESNIDNTLNAEMGFECLKLLTKSENEELLEFDKLEEASVNRGGEEVPCGHNSASVCLESYKDSDQPSPVSVLEVPFEEDKFTSGCFEKVNADLQELRMQIRRLKQDSVDCYANNEEVFESSDVDAGESYPELEDVVQGCREEEDRDNSYILDMLIYGGVLKSVVDGFITSCHSADHPVAMHVFNKLEKKYKSVESWPRADRELLFDLTNAILADIIMPKLMKNSNLVHDDLIKLVWQAVVKEKMDVGNSFEDDLTGLQWVGFEDDKEVIGRELQDSIQEDLMDELVVELACIKVV